MPMPHTKPVKVTYAHGRAAKSAIVASFDTLKEAEDYIAHQATLGAVRKRQVLRGDFAIDAPETLVTPTKGHGIRVTVQVHINAEILSSLLCSAFEGGSNYWYLIAESHKPNGAISATGADEYCSYIDNPLNVGGWVKITTLEGDEIEGKKEWMLDMLALDRGMQVLADNYPRHFADIMTDHADAETGDVFLQCCLFGEIIFG